MTVKELLLQIYGMVGEPSDLCPYNYDSVGVATFNNTTAGCSKLLALLNRAYQRLAMYKLPGDRLVRFREFNRVAYYKPIDILSGVYSADGITISVLRAEGIPLVGNNLNGFFVEIGGEVRIITASADGAPEPGVATYILTLDKAFADNANLVGQPVKIYTRVVPLATTANPLNLIPGQSISVTGHSIVTITKVTNVTFNDQVLSMPTRDFRFFEYPRAQANPTQYMITGRGLEFNYAPISGSCFKIEYYATPEQLTVDANSLEASQIPLIPAAWHEILWMMATWIRLKEDKNIEEANYLERDMRNYCASLVEQGEHSWDWQNQRTSLTDYWGQT